MLQNIINSFYSTSLDSVSCSLLKFCIVMKYCCFFPLSEGVTMEQPKLSGIAQVLKVELYWIILVDDI